MPTDYSNDTHAEREQLAQKVFAFINNPNSDKKQIEEVYLYLNELLELYPEQKPDWQKTEGLLTDLICEPNAYCYRESFAEIVGETILDLSNHSIPEGECLDLAKKVSDAIRYGDSNEVANAALDTISEMENGLAVYTPEYVANLICKETNADYIPQLKALFEGENNETAK